jgi:hypothetical protein
MFIVETRSKKMCELCNTIENKIRKIKLDNDSMFEREFIDHYKELTENQCDRDCADLMNKKCDWSIKTNNFSKKYTPSCEDKQITCHLVTENSYMLQEKNEFIDNFMFCPYCGGKIQRKD